MSDEEEEELENTDMEAAASDLLELPHLIGSETDDEEEDPRERRKRALRRNQVGTGSIKYAPSDLKTLEGIATIIMGVTNSSMMVIGQRIQMLKHTTIRDADLVRKQNSNTYELEEDGEENDREFINDIKREYILKNLMKTISMVPDLKNKICCIIYLMKKGAHVTYHEYFKLVPIDTEFEYINQNNEWINMVIDDIFQDVFQSTHELEDVMANFKASVDPEISQYINDKFSEVDLVNLNTGDLYRRMKRHFGERFTKEDKQLLGKFMSDFKNIKTKSIVRDLPYYLEKFQMSMSDWTNRMRDLRALKEINRLSAFDWLNIA